MILLSDIKIELPPGEELEIDFQHLEHLTYEAAKKTLELLTPFEVIKTIRTLYRGERNSFRGNFVYFPHYWDGSVRDRTEELRKNEETLALTDYLWEMNAYKKTFTRPNPNKDTWARAIFHELVQQPLIKALQRTRIGEYIDREEIGTWSVKEKYLREAVSNQIEYSEELKNGILTAIAICPLGIQNMLPEGTEVVLGDAIIRHWSLKERFIFYSLHGNNYFWDDYKNPIGQDHIIEIKHSKANGDGKYINKVQTADSLDLLKWGLFVSSGVDIPLSEGTCLMLSKTGDYFERLHRDENHSTDISFDSGQIDTCKAAIKDFSTLLESSINKESKGDLYHALWHFGRSCVSTLDRDILLEAAIGLDRLLTTSGGEVQYRFCVHGAAILSSLEKNIEDPYKMLKDIYKERSDAAHGKTSKQLEITKNRAIQCRKLLAEVILAIIKLEKDQRIDLNYKDQGVALTIQNYVIQILTGKDLRASLDTPEKRSTFQDM